MVNPISCVIPEITIHNNRAVTTSIAVADFFQKQHKDVLRKITGLECSPAFTQRNFTLYHENNELQNGKPQPVYEMTRNGFIFLVMGFTGKKASAFKEAYIAEFDRLETELHQQPLPTTSSTMIQGSPRTVVIHFDEVGSVSYTEQAPAGSVVATVDSFSRWMEQHGWVIISKDTLLEKLTS